MEKVTIDRCSYAKLIIPKIKNAIYVFMKFVFRIRERTNAATPKSNIAILNNL